MLSRPEILSLSVLAVLAVLLLLAALFAWRRTRYTLPQAVLYSVNTLVTRVLWRAQISGSLPLAPHEGGVIVSNHRSGIDPLLIQLTTKRVVHWMVAREYIEHPSMAWAFRILRSIPVNRGGVDTAATKLAIRIAKQGGLVGNFPEARVNVTERLLLPGRSGAALIALRARVRVVPCYVIDPPYDGSALGPFLMTGKARVLVGSPLDLSEYFQREGEEGVLEEITKRFLIEIARLAGAHNFTPELAAKNRQPRKQVQH